MRYRLKLLNRLAACVALVLTLQSSAVADEFDREPILYSKSTPRDCISRLQQRLDAGETTLKFDRHGGFLASMLQELQVPASSQMLVFSKTSLQRQRITPETPRAIYFNDDVYVGMCQDGDVLEISAVDPQLGMIFYTLEQQSEKPPKFARQTDSCLLCHGSTQSQGIPGNLVRSVYPDPDGFPILSSGSFRIDQTSPIENRWGGWYVTGEHGAHKHLGNLIVRGKQQPEEIDNSAGMNVTDLSSRLELSPYLTTHSDIIALMVLEHQAMAHNLIIQANFSTRQALHYEALLNRELQEPMNVRRASTLSRIRSVADPLVKYLLFSGEAKLQSPIKGTSGYAEQFAKTGPRDSHGRSLRDFDLRTRLFKYPCSYLIYSPAFDALPPDVRDYVLQRIWNILDGQETSADFAHLTDTDRQVIKQILQATKPNLPDYWKRAD